MGGSDREGEGLRPVQSSAVSSWLIYGRQQAPRLIIISWLMIDRGRRSFVCRNKEKQRGAAVGRDAVAGSRLLSSLVSR